MKIFLVIVALIGTSVVCANERPPRFKYNDIVCFSDPFFGECRGRALDRSPGYGGGVEYLVEYKCSTGKKDRDWIKGAELRKCQ